MSAAIANKTYTRIPPRVRRSFFNKAARALKGTVLAPFYLQLARRRGQPGTEFAAESAALAARVLLRRGHEIPLAELYCMLFWPVESTRYFEFSAAWQLLSGLTIHRFLDVSSPRLFPIALARSRPEASAELINPDP